MQCVYKVINCVLLGFVSVCLSCHTFGNVSVEIFPKEGAPFTRFVVGCIEPSRFKDSPDLQVTQVKFNDQKIPRMVKGTMQNMARLKYIVMNNTFTESVEPGAFRNLPRLAALFLIHSQVDTIRNNVFQNLPSLLKLRLHHNEISVIEDYAFANIPTLKHIYLGSNKIEQWNTTWFINSTALQEIDIQKNLLSKIPTKSFPGLTNLSKIILDHNKISKIENDAFEGIEHLELLSLQNNCLKEISSNIFSLKTRIDSMFVDSNLLTFITNEVLEKISLKEMSLSSNPWKCPCLQRTLFWFYQTPGSSALCRSCRSAINTIPVCIYANVFANTCLDIIDDEAIVSYFNFVNNTDILTKCIK